MSEVFKQHIQKFTNIEEPELSDVMAFFSIRQVKKKVNLLIGGQVCRTHFFVTKGCLRKFFLTDKGTERTTEFAIEHWWLTDNLAYERGLPTEFYIQAVENSEIVCLDRQLQQELLKQHPQMERYFRFIYQRAYAAAQLRIKYLYENSKESSYQQFVEKYPWFIQRIPQYLIASFLGLSPEYLSEIRRKSR